MKMKTPLTLAILTIMGLALAAWMILYGLQLRFFGTFIDQNGLLSIISPPNAFKAWVGWISIKVSFSDLGWPLLVVGCSLLGSIAGLWLRQSWAPRSLLIFSAASLITFHWMNLLSILLLVLAGNKAMQQSMIPDPATHG